MSSDAAVQFAVHGIFGRRSECTLQQLVREVVSEVLEGADAEAAEIDAIFVGNVFGPTGVASRVARDSGLAGVPVTRVEAACASGTLAVDMAVRAVREGRYEKVLALGIEQLSSVFDGPIVPEMTDAEGALGLPLPGLYAMQAQWYVEKYGYAEEELGLVAVKNRAMGALNDRAQRREAVTLEQVRESRMIAEPLTVLQCCPVSDGAAAAVIGRPRPGRSDVPVLGIGFAGGEAWPGVEDEPWGAACVRRATRLAEEDAGMSVARADLLEVHDAFTIGELVTVEAMGLAGPGDALARLRDGEFHQDGSVPVNMSGGLLSRGHALGATGIAQVAEICAHLTERAGERQVASPNVGVVETMGGGASGLDGNAAGVIFLGAPD